jgi:hypothetical protein
MLLVVILALLFPLMSTAVARPGDLVVASEFGLQAKATVL